MSASSYQEPARTVISRFGDGDIAKGVSAVSAIVGCNPSWVYKWMYPKDRGGRAGEVPPSAWPILLEHARELQVPLSIGDLNPELRPFLELEPPSEAA